MSKRSLKLSKCFVSVVMAFALTLLLGCTSTTTSTTSTGSTGSAGSTASTGSTASLKSEITTAVIIDTTALDGGAETNYDVSVESGATVLDALAATGLETTVEDSDYGAYVSAIDGYAQNAAEGYYWTYTVNGDTIMDSAGDYVLSDGDEVVWTYGIYE